MYQTKRHCGDSPVSIIGAGISGAWHALLFAPSAAILAYAFARSMTLTLKNNGVAWRGTRYPLPELRANAMKMK